MCVLFLIQDGQDVHRSCRHFRRLLAAVPRLLHLHLPSLRRRQEALHSTRLSGNKSYCVFCTNATQQFMNTSRNLHHERLISSSNFLRSHLYNENDKLLGIKI